MKSVLSALVFGSLLVTASGCGVWNAAGSSALGPGEFEITVDRVLDDDTTKIIVLELTFYGEQRVGTHEDGGLSYTSAGSGSQETQLQSARILIHADQTEQKRGDEVIRTVRYSVVPMSGGSRAGGSSQHTLRENEQLADVLKLTLPAAGRYSLDEPIEIGTWYDKSISMYVGSPAGWSRHFGE